MQEGYRRRSKDYDREDAVLSLSHRRLARSREPHKSLFEQNENSLFEITKL